MHRPIFASVFVAAFLLIGGMREVWAIDWGECQRTGFSELKPEIVIPSCSQIIETGKASEEDLAIAYFRRGRGYHKDGDLDRAIADYSRAVEQGYAPAQFNLGRMYDYGEGVAQDYAEAVRWYRLAAEQGDAEAQFSLGAMYVSGQGVPQDDAEAVKWFGRAAEQGLAEAQFSLGAMYEYGAGVPLDFKEAAKWYRLAVRQGLTEARQALTSLEQGSPDVASCVSLLDTFGGDDPTKLVARLHGAEAHLFAEWAEELPLFDGSAYPFDTVVLFDLGDQILGMLGFAEGCAGASKFLEQDPVEQATAALQQYRDSGKQEIIDYLPEDKRSLYSARGE